MDRDDKEQNEIDLKRFIDKWDNGGGFMRSLCDAICKSDIENLRKLNLAYPDLVNGYCMYAFNKPYDEFMY